MWESLHSMSKEMNFPKVSVVVTTFNRAHLLERAVRSVFGQSYSNFDIHIVDDASGDETQQVTEAMLADRDDAHYHRHDHHKGLAVARNTGISQSDGQYIAFLDDDDEWKPDCLEKRVELLMKLSPEEREKTGVVYCGSEIHIVHEGRITYGLPRVEGNIKEYICANELSTVPSSQMFSRAALEKVCGFDENLCSSVDHDIWMILAVKDYHACAVKEPLVVEYRTKRRRSMVSDGTVRIKGVEQYLSKWLPTFEQWFGTKGGRRYVRRYRVRVLGMLAGVKLCEGDFRQWWRVVRHVVAQNRRSLIESAMLWYMIGRFVVRMCVPAGMIDRFAKIRKGSFENCSPGLRNT